MTARRLLGVSWCMPPALFPRSIQVARLLKGLKRLGWESTVVAPDLSALSPRDPIDTGLSAIYGSEYSLARVDLSLVHLSSAHATARWLVRWRGEHHLTQDELWVKRAARRCLQVSRRVRPDVLVTFAQPWRDHLVGLALRRLGWRRPWVAHFSDPWVDSIYSTTTGAARDAEREMERRVLEQANRVVFTNQHAADLVMAKYPPRLQSKARVVPHAMDEEVMPPPPPRDGAGPLRLAHVGNLFAHLRTGRALLEAIEMLQARQGLAGRLELLFVGEGSGVDDAGKYAFVHRLEPFVKFLARVPYVESLALMCASDVLTVIDAPAEINVFLPSKLADYLMARRPILALTPDRGATADIMRCLGYPIVSPTHPQAVAGILQRLLDEHARGALTASPKADMCAGPFRLEAVAEAFADILEECLVERQ